MLSLRNDLLNYAFALAAVLAAAVFRFAIDPVLDDNLPYYVFYFAVLAAAIWGGIGPGLTALALAFLGASYLFAYPRYSLEIMDKEDILGAFRFVSIGLLLILLGHWGRTKRRDWQLNMDAKERGFFRREGLPPPAELLLPVGT